MHTSTSNSGILSFVIGLSVFFAALNHFGGATLPWYWVLSPLWITALSVPALFVIVGLRYAYLAIRRSLENPAKPCPSTMETV